MGTITFTQGFEFLDFHYGWHQNKLYRLPSIKHGRLYGLRKLPVIQITEQIKGYRLVKIKKSKTQVLAMTKKIKIKVKIL